MNSTVVFTPLSGLFSPSETVLFTDWQWKLTIKSSDNCWWDSLDFFPSSNDEFITVQNIEYHLNQRWNTHCICIWLLWFCVLDFTVRSDGHFFPLGRSFLHIQVRINDSKRTKNHVLLNRKGDIMQVYKTRSSARRRVDLTYQWTQRSTPNEWSFHGPHLDSLQHPRH